MANVFPDQLPDEWRTDPVRRAEIKLWKAISDQLSDLYDAFYSVSFHVRRSRRRMLDGELDVLIVHPRFGTLVVEVKGGQISRQEGQWRSRSLGGHDYSIKNPFEQAKNNKYALLDYLRDNPQTSNYRYPVNYCVCFPDCEANPDALGIDAPRGLVLDAVDIQELAKSLQRVFREWTPNKTTSAELPHSAIKALRGTLAPTWALPETSRRGWRKTLATQERLTEEQYRLLDFLSRQRRAVIEGCAGSGKTYMAIEKAGRLAKEGFSVALLCHNKHLASWLRRRTSKSGLEFCGTVGKFLQGESLVDAVVLDEAQDLTESERAEIEERILSDDIFYVFADNNQRVRKVADLATHEPASFVLTQNLRSTSKLHKFAMQYYQGGGEPSCPISGGNPPVFRQTGGDLRSAISAALDSITAQGIDPRDVAILTARAGERYGKRTSSLWGASAVQCGKWPTVRQAGTQRTRADTEVGVYTIQSFKGLERSAIIVCELDGLLKAPEEIEQLEAIAYLASTRARLHLEVLVESSSSAGFKALFPDAS